MGQTRRQMLKSIGFIAAAPHLLFSGPQSKALPISFSTLGCPKWDWHTILKRASEWGYAAIELRGIQGEMDLTKRPEFGKAGLKTSLADLKAMNLKVCNLGSSAHLHEFESSKNAEQMSEAKRFIDLAHELKAPCVRVFGDKIVEGKPKQATVDRIIAGLQELGKHARASGVTVILESHGDFPDSATLLQIMQGANMSEVGLLWDAHHTFVTGKEKPADTYRQLSRYIRHTHLKDSVPSGKDVRYVLTGSGAVPIRDIVQVLAKGGYRGYYGYEWEKAWIPDIEEPEIAFPHYAKIMREYLGETGAKIK